MFFYVKFLKEPVLDRIELFALIVIIFFVISKSLLNPEPHLKKRFRFEVNLFLLSAFLSMPITYFYHHQGFETTLIAQRFMYFYLFYFLLHILRLKAFEVERLMVIIGVLYLAFFLLQYIFYPIILFDVRIDESRGTLRIFLPALGFMFLTYYKFLQEFLNNLKVRHAIFLLLFLLVGGVLQGTRQTLASMILITAAYIFFSKQVKSKFFVISLASVASIAVFFLFQDIFLEIIATTQMEKSDQETNIRSLAATFFLTDFMPSNIAYILGNGQDSMNSIYGERIYLYKTLFGFFQSDIGIIGDYSKFGVLFVVAQISVLSRVIFGKLHPKISYMRYLFISIALMMFTGRNFFGTSGGIVFIVMVLYIIECYNDQAFHTSMKGKDQNV